MKIRIFTWEEALKAVIKRDNESYTEESNGLYGINKNWEYWGKIVDTLLIEVKENLIDYYVVDGFHVPTWLVEVLDDKIAEDKSNKEDMTAEEFVHGLKRMCEYYGSRCYKGEDECPLIYRACVTSKSLSDDMIGIVKDWIGKHPVKTRQSEFLKQFTKANVDEDGVLRICPNYIDSTVKCHAKVDCNVCREKYWNEVTE